jgi:hypothetical protein
MANLSPSLQQAGGRAVCRACFACRLGSIAGAMGWEFGAVIGPRLVTFLDHAERPDSDIQPAAVHDYCWKLLPFSTARTGAWERLPQPMARAHLSDVCW